VVSLTAAKVLAMAATPFPCPRSLLRCPCREQDSIYPRCAAGETSYPSSIMCVLGRCSAVKNTFLVPLLLLFELILRTVVCIFWTGLVLIRLSRGWLTEILYARVVY
jgi:hypothetical protein